MSNWCVEYVNIYSREQGKKSVGGIEHAPFYAVTQAFLFVFCYRHNELDPAGNLKFLFGN